MADDWYTGMDTGFASRLKQLIDDSNGAIWVGSGYRSVEEQQALWDQAVIDYGPEEARKWVAPPGSSNHNHGVAADLGYATDEIEQWVHDNAYRYGLVFPMGWEPWHIEPIGVRDGTYQSSVPVDGHLPGEHDAYTTAPAGQVGAADATRRFDLGYQLTQLNSLMMLGDTILANPNARQQTGAAPSTNIAGGS